MIRKYFALSKTGLIIGVVAAALVLGWSGQASAVKVTIDELNKMRADVGLRPLSGEMASDLPMLHNECEQGIDGSCTVLNSIIEQFSPGQSRGDPDTSESPEAPSTQISGGQQARQL